MPNSQEAANLSALLAAALAENKRVVAENTELKQEVKLLREKLSALLAKIYESSSEKLDPAQLQMMFEGLDLKVEEPVPAAGPESIEEAPAPAARTKEKRNRRPRTPDHLPIVEERIVPGPVKESPDAWRHIGDEVTELLDYQPAKFFKRHIIREKYVRKEHPFTAPVIAPLTTMQERCIAAPGLVAAVAVGKFCDHVPLYRQQAIFALRHRVYIPRQTMAQWMALLAGWLQCIYKAVLKEVLNDGYVQVDETFIKYLVPGNGKTEQGYLWTCSKPGGDVVFFWDTTRAADSLTNIIPSDWSGTIQCDGYSAYPAFVREHNAAANMDLIQIAGCLAHVRRDIYEARETAPRQAAWLLNHIANLYGIEKRLRQESVKGRIKTSQRGSK